MKGLKVFVDGGARGNPGPAATGVFIVDQDDQPVFAQGKYIGRATNNEAEYKAAIEAMKFLNREKKNIDQNTRIDFFLDSQLVYSQIIGLFKIKEPRLRELLFNVREEQASLGLDIFFHHIPREKNKEADKLVNSALEETLQ